MGAGFFFVNDTANIPTPWIAGATWWVHVSAQTMKVWDGAQWVVASVEPAGTDMIYVPANFRPGLPSDDEVVLVHRFARRVTFAANFAGSQGVALGAATASAVCNIYRAPNATPTTFSSIGTATFGAAGNVPTFSMASPQIFEIGDVMKVHAPTPADATLENVSMTFLGIRS